MRQCPQQYPHGNWTKQVSISSAAASDRSRYYHLRGKSLPIIARHEFEVNIEVNIEVSIEVNIEVSVEALK